MNIRKIMETEEGFEELEQGLLGLDSEFRFKCRRCGKCCKDQNTILLNPRDIFNIGKKLGKSMSAVIGDYAEVYIGQDSRVPVVHLLPKGPKNTCPLLVDGRCSVHDCKPTVCALYPLGRVLVAPTPGEPSEPWNEMEVRYILNDYTCGSAKRVNTVRSWLQKFGIPEHDDFFIQWNKTIVNFSLFVRDMEKKECSEEKLKLIWNAAYNILYTQYNITLDFEPQFQRAISRWDDFCHRIQEIQT